MDSPAYAVLAIAAVSLAAVLYWTRPQRTGQAGAGVLVLALRCAILAVLLLAAAGLFVDVPAERSRVSVVVLDVSESVPASARRESVDVLLGHAERVLRAGGHVAVVCFAGRARLVAAGFPHSVLEPRSADPHPAGVAWKIGDGVVSLEEVRETLDLVAGAPGRRDLKSAASPDGSGNESKTLSGLDRASLQPMRSDLAGAITLARSVCASYDEREMIIFTDGMPDGADSGVVAWDGTDAIAGRGTVSRESGVKLKEMLAACSAEGIRIVAVPLADEDFRDAAAVSLDVPASIRGGEPFVCEVRFRTNFAGKASVTLLADSKVVALKEELVQLPGEQTWTLGPARVSPGFHVFAASVEMDSDMEERNNAALAGAYASGRLNCLLLEGADRAGDNLASCLEVEGIGVERRSAQRTPRSVLGLHDYDCCILVEPDLRALTAEQGRALTEYVRVHGGGLFVVSGVAGDGQKRLSNNDLAGLLPLEFLEEEIAQQPEIPDEPEEPPPDTEPDTHTEPTRAEDGHPTEVARVALVLLLDKSGSMIGKKIALLRESAIATAETLSKDDILGVVAFDAQPRWVIDPVEVSSATGIDTRIAQLRAGGDTNIYPALVEAYRALSKLDAQVKHVILLTDGYSRFADFLSLVETMVRDGMTVSTIGIGDEFDGNLLASIARWGKGRYYYTSDFTEVPQVFTIETRRSRSPVTDGTRSGGREEGEKPEVAKTDTPSGGSQPGGNVEPSEKTTKKPGPKQPKDVTPPTPVALDVVVRSAAPFLEGFAPEDIPSIGGVLNSRIRGHAQLVLAVDPRLDGSASAATVSSDADRPALAFAYEGAGRVAAWASDLSTREGAGAWLQWSMLPKVIAQLVRSLSLHHSKELKPLQAECQPGSGGVQVRVRVHGKSAEALRAGNRGGVSAAYVEQAPGGNMVREMALARTGIAEFEGFLPLAGTGSVARTALTFECEDGSRSGSLIGIAVPHEPEVAWHALGERFFKAAGDAGVNVVPLETAGGLEPAPARFVQGGRIGLRGGLLAIVPFLLILELAIRRTGSLSA
ncbi:MAG: VWA domain-containing protein [Planctomycetota bacterium]|nr:VWA domain-containing protein [Planctomycetota bacterium]